MVVVVAHRGMRALIVDLLARDGGRWVVSTIDGVAELDKQSPNIRDLLLVVDTADFDACCRQLPASFPIHHVVVIGPEPDLAYRQAALRRGAGAWLSRERVAEELHDCLCSALGCACGPHPAPVVERRVFPFTTLKRDHDD